VNEAVVEEITGRLRISRRVLFVTGAGISADSGLPTYRGVGGLYNDALTEDGLTIEDALSGACLMARPEITWKYLSGIEVNCNRVSPNAAHSAIAALEQHLDVVVLTQNIDGLHIRAGSSNVIEIHGSLDHRVCMRCGCAADPGDRSVPPYCGECGGVVRPRVVLFGEMLPEVALDSLHSEMKRGFDMVFVVGTSAVFPYIAEPVLRAAYAGVPTVEINPVRTVLSEKVAHHLALRAVEVLPSICSLGFPSSNQ